MELFWAATFAILGMVGSATLVVSSDHRPVTWSVTSVYLLSVSATLVGITMIMQIAMR